VKVTFSLPADSADSTVELYGDFNDWQDAMLLRQEKDGAWKTTVSLEPDRSYQFLYRVDGERWLNDPEADGTSPNPFGGENSVVTT
jgi:1,4-alpha-glucan branching enzyme